MPEPSEIRLVFACERLGEPALVDGSGLALATSRVYFDFSSVRMLEGPAVHGLMKCACTREVYVRVLPGTQPHETLTRKRCLSNIDTPGIAEYQARLAELQAMPEGEDADALRDRMDDIWYALTYAEQDYCNGWRRFMPALLGKQLMPNGGYTQQ